MINELCVFFFFAFFFFQAEDGIRDLVRSRGLGDVYKRQPPTLAGEAAIELGRHCRREIHPDRQDRRQFEATIEPAPTPVSYTHLTLPTSDLV